MAPMAPKTSLLLVFGLGMAAQLCRGYAFNSKGTNKLVEMWKSFDDSTVCSDEIEKADASCAWPDPRYSCEDSNTECSGWAKIGECEANPIYMLINCAKSCGSCFLKDRKFRCKRDEEKHPPAISESGKINAMFERAITDDNYQEFKPVVHSHDPWLITFENFLSKEEVEEFLKDDQIHQNFKRSVDAGALRDDGQFEAKKSNARTSSSMWCTEECWNRPIMQKMAHRISNITGIPVENGEYPQILRYQKGQKYVRHHDYIPGHLDLPIGPRLYTFFVYLSDVEEGGETNFPTIGVKVTPKAGKAVLWPSVKNEAPLEKEPRTQHEALPVAKGIKYSMNIWLHMYNFHDYFEISCTG